MKLNIFFIFSLLFVTNIHSQISNKSTANLKISAKIFEDVSHQPIEYATISLINDSTHKTINGSISNKRGLFEIQNITPGIYRLLIQFMGYEDFSQKIEIAASITLPDILLKKKSVELNNVTVKSTRQIIENRLDKIVYNLDKDITSQGGIATDALKKIPGVTVDIDGNVELLGNPSVKFLIDGKPSAIFGNSIADALQSIPNSQIQSIEVITSPSAKYDASGTGGIINIILKKSKIEGFNGNINLAAGTRLENGSLNIAYKKGAVALNAYFSGNAQLTSTTPNGSDRITTPLTNRFIQDNISDFYRNGYKSGLGMEWTLSKSETLSASIGFSHFGTNNSGISHQQSLSYDNSGILLSHIYSDRISGSKFNVLDFENSAVYRKKFKKEGRELELAYNATYGNNTSSYHQEQFHPGTSNAYSGSNSENPGKENEINFELNYTEPISEKVVIETGLRTTLIDIISAADVYTLNGSTGTYAKDMQQSYSSDFKRTIYAGYFSLDFPLANYFDVKAGARYEYTKNTAYYSNSSNVHIPDYRHFIPSFIIAHNFPNQQSLKFAYSYRIERPEFRDLNPFMNLADPHNISTGNPNLEPEIGNKFELSYNKSFEAGGNISITAFYQRNSPDIKPYITYYPTYKIGDSIYTDVTVTTRATIAAEVRAGVNIAGSIPFGKKVTLRPNLQIYNRHLNNPNTTPAITNAFGLRGSANLSYLISKNLAAEFFGNYNLGMRWQGKQADVYSYTFALRKQFSTKASLGLIAVNPFNKYVKQYSQQKTPDFYSDIYRFTPYRSFGVTFTYKFGKLKFKPKEKEGDNFNYSTPENQ
ncbi:MAG: outer membrane beta-barrel family protein [Bacteroidota bacterium]